MAHVEGVRLFAHPNKVVQLMIPKSACTSRKAASRDGRQPIKWAAVERGRYRDCWWFTFVRHPLDRLVSAYHGDSQFYQQWQWEEFARDIVTGNPGARMAQARRWVGFDKHTCPQSWIVDMCPKMDFIGRFENLGADWTRCREASGYMFDALDVLNASKHKPWETYYSDELRAQAERYYAEDLRRWYGIPDS